MNPAWLMVGASFLFATMGVCVKLASADYSTGEIVFYRSAIGTLMVWGAVRWRGGSLKTSVPQMHFWRTACGISALCMWFYSICKFPLATAMTLNYMSSVWMALFLIGGAALRIVFYFSLGGVVAGAGLATLTDGWHAHHLRGVALLLAVGLLATTAQFMMTRAYGRGKPLVNASLAYLGIVFSFGYGVWLFDDRITWLAVTGMVLIVGSGMAATMLRQGTPAATVANSAET